MRDRLAKDDKWTIQTVSRSRAAASSATPAASRRRDEHDHAVSPGTCATSSTSSGARTRTRSGRWARSDAPALCRRSDAPPPAREPLEVADDGSMTGWLSQARSWVPVAARYRISRDCVPWSRRRPGRRSRPPATRRSTRRSTPLTSPDGARVAGARGRGRAVGDLLAAARTLLLDALPAMPAAAVELAFPGPDRLRLVHRGAHRSSWSVGAASAEVTRWRDGIPVGSAETRDLRLGRVEAGPWWSPRSRWPSRRRGRRPADGSAWLVANDEGIHACSCSRVEASPADPRGRASGRDLPHPTWAPRRCPLGSAECRRAPSERQPGKATAPRSGASAGAATATATSPPSPSRCNPAPSWRCRPRPATALQRRRSSGRSRTR